MRTSLVAVLAVAGLTGWQVQRVVTVDQYRPVQSAYEDAVQRYRGGESLRHSVSPRQTVPLADAGDMSGVDNARMAEGANASGVEPSYRISEGANATGVDNARLAEGANATGVDNARLAEGANSSGVETDYRTSKGADATSVNHARLAEGANASGVEISYRTAEGANATGVDNARMG